MIGLLTGFGLSQRLASILAPLIGLAVVLALCAALWVRGNHYKDQRDVARAEVAAEEARHAVTRQSVETLDAVIVDLNNRALARAEAYAEGQAEAQKRSAELAKLSAESDRRIEALRKAAREQVNGDCPVPANLAELAKGL